MSYFLYLGLFLPQVTLCLFNAPRKVIFFYNVYFLNVRVIYNDRYVLDIFAAIYIAKTFLDIWATSYSSYKVS